MSLNIGGESESYGNGGSNKKNSYYVEENEKMLNMLITNCQPIL